MHGRRNSDFCSHSPVSEHTERTEAAGHSGNGMVWFAVWEVAFFETGTQCDWPSFLWTIEKEKGSTTPLCHILVLSLAFHNM